MIVFENWNRYYDPSIGRYLQPEPLLEEPLYPATMAMQGHATPVYAYASNNPLFFTDRNGLQSCSPGMSCFGGQFAIAADGEVVAATAATTTSTATTTEAVVATTVAVVVTATGEGYDPRNPQPPKVDTTATTQSKPPPPVPPKNVGGHCKIFYAACVASCSKECSNKVSNAACVAGCSAAYLICLAAN